MEDSKLHVPSIAGLPVLTVAEAIDEELARDPLREFHVWWDDVTEEDVAALRTALDRATGEPDMQAYLQEHPLMLVQSLGGGHGRWVLPQKSLGGRYVPDFIIGDRDSGGRRWIAVELEGPQRPIFNKNGDPSRYLSHAIAQIQRWRSWLTSNRPSAVASRAEEGEGLEDIDSNVPALIIIGRRGETPLRTGVRRRIEHENRLEIHTYDWLVERAAGRVASLAASSAKRPSSKHR